jgi:hypothetical protein
MSEIARSTAQKRRPRGTRTRLLKERKKPADALVCACGLYQHRGRWLEGHPPLGEVREGTCPACDRVQSCTAAGRLRIPARLAEELSELIGLVRNCEAKERADHPLERLMEVKKDRGGLLVTTTGPHLARRIAHRLGRRFHEKPRFRFGAGKGELRVEWDA